MVDIHAAGIRLPQAGRVAAKRRHLFGVAARRRGTMQRDRYPVGIDLRHKNQAAPGKRPAKIDLLNVAVLADRLADILTQAQQHPRGDPFLPVKAAGIEYPFAAAAEHESGDVPAKHAAADRQGVQEPIAAPQRIHHALHCTRIGRLRQGYFVQSLHPFALIGQTGRTKRKPYTEAPPLRVKTPQSHFMKKEDGL